MNILKGTTPTETSLYCEKLRDEALLKNIGNSKNRKN